MVVVSKPGGLGNRLWLYAHFAGYAAEHNVPLWFPSLDEYAGAFEGTRDDLLAGYPPRRRLWPRGRYSRRLCFEAFRVAAAGRVRIGAPGTVAVVRLDWGQTLELDGPAFQQLVRDHRVVVGQGWQFRADALVHAHADRIRRHLTPIRSVRAEGEATVARARENGAVAIGLHVRRGDYREFLEGRYHYDDATYALLMERCRRLFPGRRITFVVCSNEHTDFSGPPGTRTIRGPGGELSDLHALSRCDLIVGPPSTYSMWASYVGNVPCWVVEDPTDRVEASQLRPRHTQFLDD